MGPEQEKPGESGQAGPESREPGLEALRQGAQFIPEKGSETLGAAGLPKVPALWYILSW